MAAVASWLALVRVYRRNPAGLLTLSIQAFIAKMGFFLVYVIVAIKVVGLPMQAFGISFVLSFVVFYAIEAVMIARLMREGVKGVR